MITDDYYRFIKSINTNVSTFFRQLFQLGRVNRFVVESSASKVSRKNHLFHLIFSGKGKHHTKVF